MVIILQPQLESRIFHPTTNNFPVLVDGSQSITVDQFSQSDVSGCGIISGFTVYTWDRPGYDFGKVQASETSDGFFGNFVNTALSTANSRPPMFNLCKVEDVCVYNADCDSG